MSARTPRPIEYMLRDVREALHMDVAFVSASSEDQLVFRALEGDAESFGCREGESSPIDESYCKRVLDGRIPRVVPDAEVVGRTTGAPREPVGVARRTGGFGGREVKRPEDA
jgi:hypothetical protein